MLGDSCFTKRGFFIVTTKKFGSITLVLVFGFFLGIASGVLFYRTLIDPIPEYNYRINYSDNEFSLEVMEQLDAKGIQYSYKLDHLKRQWITPHVNDRKVYEDFLVEFCKDFPELCNKVSEVK